MPALLHFPQAANILYGFSDSDYVSDSDTFRSISGYLFVLKGLLFCGKSTRTQQPKSTRLR
jgi:hypothetical protein